MATQQMPSRFTMCCLAPVLNPEKDDGYYVALGLERDASAAAIRKAFRKLSLRLHPDKRAQRGEAASPEADRDFARAKEAYECLSDAKKRRLYDHLGEIGVRFYENPASVTPEMYVRVIGKMGEGCRCTILLVLLLALGFLFLFFPVFLSFNVDGRTRLPWSVVFLPVWVVDAYVLLCHALWVAEGCCGSGGPDAPPDEELGSGGPRAPEDDDDDDDDDDGFPPGGGPDDAPLVARVFVLVKLLLVIAFQILLVWKLDGSASRAVWPLVFLPLLLRELLALASFVPGSLATVEKPDIDESAAPLNPVQAMENEMKAAVYVAAVELQDACRRGLRTVALRICLEVLLLCKLSDMPDGAGEALNWFAVFSPLWLYLRRSFVFGAPSRATLIRLVSSAPLRAKISGRPGPKSLSASLVFGARRAVDVRHRHRYALIALGRALLYAAAARSIAATMTPPPPDADPADDSWMTDADKVKGEASAAATMSALASGCSCCCVVLVGVLVALKAAEYDLPAVAIFSPVFVVVGCCYCCVCLGICGVGRFEEPPDVAGENEVEAPPAAAPAAAADVAPAAPPTTTPLYEAAVAEAPAASAPAAADDPEVEMGDLD